MYYLTTIGYIIQKNNSYDITNLGIEFIEILEKLNINLWKEKSVEISKKLKQIYKNEITIDDIINFVKNELIDLVKNNEPIKINSTSQDESVEVNSDIICPKCSKGKILSGQKNFYCSEYKSGCKFNIWKEISGLKINESILKNLCSNKHTEVLNFKSKTGKKFKSKLTLDDDFNVKFEF